MFPNRSKESSKKTVKLAKRFNCCLKSTYARFKNETPEETYFSNFLNFKIIITINKITVECSLIVQKNCRKSRRTEKKI